MRDQPAKTHPLLALLLLVPAPTIGVLLAMWYEPTAGTLVGQAAYGLAKVWLLGLPIFWLLFIERGRLSLSPAKKGGFGIAAALGLAISAVIIGAYLILGSREIDPAAVRDVAQSTGIADKGRFVIFALYIIAINAVLEEYVWRWFVFRQCERLFPAAGGAIAVLLSAALFTVHHVFALAVQFNSLVTVLGSLGVFIGGAVWSWCYLRYRSIWPGYVSHAIVDVAIFAIGWRLIFG